MKLKLNLNHTQTILQEITEHKKVFTVLQPFSNHTYLRKIDILLFQQSAQTVHSNSLQLYCVYNNIYLLHPRFSYKKFEEIKRLLRTIKTLELAKSLLNVIYVLTKCIKEATLVFWYLLNKSLHFITFFMMRQYVMKKILFLRISFLGSPQHFLHFGS